ncbi:type 1 glutamine amidotransferase [Sphingomonas sp.]|jgi:GMP synthase (glutamine-hydrolysing)|uniref:type 1 glutamine amidotransferase n=1 Tax=Sphingomonas sp. TaxID=28214 RepID=UPI002ED8B3D7
MSSNYRFLIADSETAGERDERRRSAGKSAGETYAVTLGQMAPGCAVTIVTPCDPGWRAMTLAELRYDAVFLSGSPLHVYCDTPETRRQIAFMRLVFVSGVPSFGSCAGLQVAVAAAGGTVRKMPDRHEAGIARRITATEAGRGHPLLDGRAPVWDALAAHGDEVERLPDGAMLLATNAAAHVQAAEIRSGRGVFWGVQYHPELALGEIAAALRRDAEDLVDAGLADSPDHVEAQAVLFDQLHRDPNSRDVRWRLGVDDSVALEDQRRTELRNFIDHIGTAALRG